MSSRRFFFATSAAALLAPALAFGKSETERGRPLAFGTTPVFLDDRAALLQQWKEQLEKAMGREVRFVQRGSYREIVELILREQIDVAWLCGYPYVANKAKLRLVAVPVYQGKPLYRSYLIVPKADQGTSQISQLRDRIFAFSDPDSNSGFLVPRVELLRAGYRPETFFAKFFFTFAHRKVVEAVSAGLAQGGSVDGYIWDTLEKQQSGLTRQARVAWRSHEYGFPPIVARRTLSEAAFASFQRALISMRDHGTGKDILGQLNLDGFVRSGDALFTTIGELVRYSDS